MSMFNYFHDYSNWGKSESHLSVIHSFIKTTYFLKRLPRLLMPFLLLPLSLFLQETYTCNVYKRSYSCFSTNQTPSFTFFSSLIPLPLVPTFKFLHISHLSHLFVWFFTPQWLQKPPFRNKKKNSFQTDHPPFDLLTNLPKGCDLMAVSKVTSSYLSYKSYIALLGLQVVWLNFPLRSALMPLLTWTFPLTLPLCSLRHCHLFLLTVLPGSVTSDPRGKHVPRIYSPTYHLLPTHQCHHYTDIKITFPSLCPGARLQISSDS